MIELHNIGERLVSIVSVENYALGLLKMLEDKSQKEVAQYIGVSPSKLSPIIQLLSDTYSYKPCVIARYISCIDNEKIDYYIITDDRELDYNYYTFIDIFKFSLDEFEKLSKDIAVEIGGMDFVDNLSMSWIKVTKLSQITIEALHNLEYKHKA